MTTTPETIAELKRLLAENPATMRRDGRDVAGAAYSSWPLCRLIVAAVNALPSLLADIELLREALQAISQRHPGYGGSGEIARKALATTEAR